MPLPSPATERPAGVYVHVPHCRRRCPYCDFAIEVGASTAGFVDAVLDELDERADWIRWPASTLSLGGGTPSSLSPSELQRLTDGIRRRGLADGAEVNIEVNPEDIDADVARGLAAAGFTRVSIGLQSFDDEVLAYLGRAHDGRVAARAVEVLVSAGVDVGVDLIVGVPGEGRARLDDDVARAAAGGVGHISTYLLTLEEGTPLVRLIATKKRAAIDDDAQADAYERVREICAARGFAQYEISSHARPGRASRHNRLYWGRGNYLGLGPGAHSFRVDDDGSAHRWHTTARLAAWVAAPRAARVDEERLDGPHALREAVAFGLRDLIAGVDLAALAALHQTTVSTALRVALDESEARGDVRQANGRAWLTTRGARFADRVARDVLGG